MSGELDALISNANAYASGSKAATNQILALTSQQADLSNADATLLNATAADTTTVQAAAGAAALVTQASRVKAANIFGTNLSSSAEQITSLSQAADAAQTAKDEALKSIQQKDSVSLFDDPIQYFTNQFTINQDIAKHNAADALLQSASDRIQQINANTQSTIQTQNAISEPLTAASAAAATRIAATKSLLDANKAKQEGISYNVQGITAALNTSKEALGVQFQVQNARNTEQQIGISLQHLELSKEEFNQRKQVYEDANLFAKSVADTVNVGRTTLNLPPLTEGNGKTLLAAIRTKGFEGLTGDLKTSYESGLATQAAGIPLIGASPAKAAQALATVPSIQLNPTQLPIKNLLSSASQEVAAALSPEGALKTKNPALQGLDKKDTAGIQAAYNIVVQAKLDTYAKDIEPGAASNPYQIGSINQLAANSPTIQALPIYQKLFAPIVKSGVQLSEPSQIFSLVSDAVQKGTISHNEALELSTIYQVGVKTNLAMRNLPSFGLIPRLSYNTSLEINAAVFSSNKIVDLTKPDALSRALVSKNAATGQIGLLQNTLNILPGVGGIQQERVRQQQLQFTPEGNPLPSSTINNSIFQPQPEAAQSIETKVKSIGAAVDNFFGSLPSAADLNTVADRSRQQASGTIKPIKTP